MKKILVIAALVVIVIACHTQKTAISGNTNYTPYTKFKDDTLSYLKTNFDNNKNFYIGKPLKVLLNDLEILPISMTDFFPNKFGSKKNTIGVELKFFTREQYEYRIKNEKGSLPLYMFIDFQEAIPIEVSRDVRRENSNKVDEQYVFNDKYNPNSTYTKLNGEQIIKDIRVTPLIE